MTSDEVFARVAALQAEQDKLLLAESFDELSHSELLRVLSQREVFRRRDPAVDHAIIARLAAEACPADFGATSVADMLATRLRISTTEATRRIREAQDLAPRRAMTGESLPPVLECTAAAQVRGEIGAEHVRIIRRFFGHLPSFVDYDTREAAEAQLAEIACGFKPEELRQAADRLAILLDQDGELTDADRARRRCLTIDKQGPDGMSRIRGWLDPEARGALDAVCAKWAAPGMCNPDDESPCVDGEPSSEAIHGDSRSTGQRNHDALKAMSRALLASGQLGSHNGLPVTMVITTTLKELESGKGHAVTGGGSLLPMSEVIRQASSAHHYLAVFDDHTEEPLYLGRSRRLASAAQRIVLYAKDRGCTFPGCTAPAYHSQVHHATADWADGGQTNITDETLACGKDNRRVKPGGWRTRKRKDGRTDWIPPPQLDSGQARVNNFHHPERYLCPDDDEDQDREIDDG